MPKIAVYSCAKNEAARAKRWAESCKDADQRLVLDTGSSDDTVQILREEGVDVHSASIRPWRFDVARNASLVLLKDDIDIAVQLDLDEVLVPGWRELLEAAWTEDTNRLHYRYIWSHSDNGEPDMSFFSDKIAGRHTHIWKNPVHEVLKPQGKEVISKCDHVLIEHFPDGAKDRSYYLDLLEASVREDPLNDRNFHYLGREHFFHGNHERAIEVLLQHLRLPTATWNSERASSMRIIAKCFEALKASEHAYTWYTSATLEDGSSREALIDLAKFLLNQQEWLGCVFYCRRALMIPPDESSYLNERYALREGPYDLAAVAFWNLGMLRIAYDSAVAAATINPHDPRLQENLRFMSEALFENKERGDAIPKTQ